MSIQYREWFMDVLDQRGVRPDDICGKCNGLGVACYGNTATWRGGVGGSTMTADVCDKCWGSGSASRPWPSWRTRPTATTEEKR